MPFLILGVIMLGIGIVFLRNAIKNEDKEGIIGVTAMIIAAVILIFFFGLFYTFTIL
ncbi:hypothetical protein HQ487_03130 [Candidatus Uhrbacteria bacterium]|nr:hypothetical protein [Candidatus Uhrbacteria bacterium]